MYEVTCGDGEVFYFEKSSEIGPFFDEVVYADGADDAVITVRLVQKPE